MTATLDNVAPAEHDGAPFVDARNEPAVRRRSRWASALLFGALTAAYFTAGSIMVLRYNIFEGDAVSRVANAASAFASRDPHLSAVGFVWNPLPSLVQIPLVPLGELWPTFIGRGLAGVLQSAAFTAGSALLIRRIAIDRQVVRSWRWVAVACFAFNPVIIVYGSLGMSEGAEVFCVLWCVRYLLLWIESQRVDTLAWAGIALGVGYLVRYEVVPAAVGAIALVAVVTFTRSPRRTRLQSAILTAIVLGFPIAVAIAVWAVTGWIVSGELFAILSSQYGNASQVVVARARGGIVHDADLWSIAQRLLAMQPFVGIALIGATATSVLARAIAPMVPVVTFGTVLVFTAWAQYSATTFGWFRYYILAVPLVIVVALACWPSSAENSSWFRLPSLPAKLSAALLVCSLLIGFPVSAQAMLDQNVNDHNPVMLGVASLVDPVRYPPDEAWYRRLGIDDRRVADYLDRRRLPAGSVLADVKELWLASDNRRQFVIASDYDFTGALNHPADHAIEYVVVTNPAENTEPDAINKRYPTIWADGAGIGTLVYSADGPFGAERWRIYRVDERPAHSEGHSSP